MKSFMQKYNKVITDSLSMFDRMIFQGTISAFFQPKQFAYFLSSQNVLLKDFKHYVQSVSEQLKSHAQKIAEKYSRPYQYLDSPMTARNGLSKEDYARSIANRDGIQEGLICILSTVEPCRTVTVRSNRSIQKLEVSYRNTKCLHLYFYFIDKNFGLMHARLQTWFPFTIQIYCNGREWLSQQLDKRDIPYEKYKNSFSMIGDLQKAQKLCSQLTSKKLLSCFRKMARVINPILPKITNAGFGEYYWTLRQIELATDTIFKNRPSLEQLLPDMHQSSLLFFSAEDTMQFLHHKAIHGNFLGEIITNGKNVSKFSPLSLNDYALFGAVMSGESAINGFRNRDLRRKLFPSQCLSQSETLRLCARVSRLIKKMRSHGLVEKVPRSTLYRVTPKGLRVFSTVISFRQRFYPDFSRKIA